MGSFDIVRHPQRPGPAEFATSMFSETVMLHGDRVAFDDPGIFAGLGFLDELRIAFVGHSKETHPGAAGLRKTLRIMRMAERFDIPFVTLIDTVGKPPTELPHGPVWNIIGQTIDAMMEACVPTVAILCGQGISGGAVALATTDSMIALEHAVFMPAEPRAVSAILWRTTEQSEAALRLMSAQSSDLKKLGVVQTIVPEGEGAHLESDKVMRTTAVVLKQELTRLSLMSEQERRVQRQQRWSMFCSIGSKTL